MLRQCDEPVNFYPHFIHRQTVKKDLAAGVGGSSRFASGANPVVRLASAGAKGFEPEDIRKRLVVVGVQPASIRVANAHAAEPIALDDDTPADWRQNCVNVCHHFIV